MDVWLFPSASDRGCKFLSSNHPIGGVGQPSSPTVVIHHRFTWMSMVPSKRLGSVGFFTPIYPIHKFITHLTICQLPTSKYQRTIIARGCKNYVGSSNPSDSRDFPSDSRDFPSDSRDFPSDSRDFPSFLEGFFLSFSEVKISRFFGGQNLRETSIWWIPTMLQIYGFFT